MLTRRELLASLSSLAAFGCSRPDKSIPQIAAPSTPPLASAPPPAAASRLLEWDLAGPVGPGKAAIIVPANAPPAARFPVVIALHGRGESLKSPADGAMGWPRDYALLRAIDRVSAPPLVDDDFEGFSDPARLAQINQDLSVKPYPGLIIACPYIPDYATGAVDLRTVSHFLIDVLLPRVRSETPALATPEATGIDGVSMGGLLALRVGLKNPQIFGAVGSEQAAITQGDKYEFTELAKAARARRPGLRLRLLTSYEDPYRSANEHLSASWNAAGIAHDYADVPGPHDYVFNRGPGSIELLTWNARALT